MTFTLRPYQTDALERLRGTLKTMTAPRRVILQSETGSGKSLMACTLIRLCHEKGLSAVFAARGREIVKQVSSTLGDLGVPHGVFMRGRNWSDERVQVVSKDTFLSWVLKRGVRRAPAADLLVIDECHGVTSANGWSKLIDHYRGATLVGLTATPARADGKGLGAVFGGMVQAIPPSELIRQGFLVPTRVFAPYRPDLKGVKKDRSGDWQRPELAKKMDRPQLVGDVVQHWKEIAEGRKTVVFACTVDHALHLLEEFKKEGVRAAHIDGETDTEVRDDLIEEMTNGALQVLTSVGVLCQGVDIPALAVACIVRPTRSLVLWRQMIGRLKRPYPDKSHATVIDHSGGVYLHGLPDDDLDWTLDENVRCEALNADKREKEGKQPKHCPRCHAIVVTPVCTECGYKIEKQGKRKENSPGKLVEVTVAEPDKPEDMNRYWQYALACNAHKGRTAAAAGMMFKAKYKEWPGQGRSRGALRNLPDAGQWNLPVAVLFPQFLRGA